MIPLGRFRGALALFLPQGCVQDGGTCEFATTKCLDRCIVKLTRLRQKMSEDDWKAVGVTWPDGLAACISATGTYPPVRDAEEAWRMLREKSAAECALRLVAMLQDSDVWVLHWFASGDCPTQYTDKVTEIMEWVDATGYAQCGFTRNYNLAYAVRNLNHGRLLYTHEEKPSNSMTWQAVPDYSTGQVTLYYQTWESGGCGPDRYYNHIITRQTDCQECFRLGQGCFDGMGKRRSKGKPLKVRTALAALSVAAERV